MTDKPKPTAVLDNDAQPRTLTITLPDPILNASYPVQLQIRQDGELHDIEDGTYRIEFCRAKP